MKDQGPDRHGRLPKTSAHVCPKCGFSIDLKDIGLRGGATGLVTCPKCDWSGPVTIGIVEREPAD
jgi:ssDNA-binding Zn-finger/Zn-ribbon topoisomerase 1